jgi:hypothetical protein
LDAHFQREWLISNSELIGKNQNMKKLLIALAAVLVAAASYAQGTVAFNNRVTSIGLDAPIRMPDGVTGVGPGYSAALFLSGSSGANVLIPSSLTTFRAGAGAAYVVPSVATVAGFAAGTVANLKIRAWDTTAGSYEAALASGKGYGESAEFQVTLTEPPAFPADLPATLQGFNVTIVPEPTTLALGALGAAALLFRRRK